MRMFTDLTLFFPRLCLFWAIQSITSIGYGNIVPATALEFGFANALMLISGIFWAYIIGRLVEVVQSYSTSLQDLYLARMNEANEMMSDFTVKELPESAAQTFYPVKSSKRVRRFITCQRDRAINNRLNPKNTSTMNDLYPTLDILSPELRRLCALHLTQSLLETIPYLSSVYLSPEEQADIALQCLWLEFSSTEQFDSQSELGRGILIFRQGFALISRKNAPLKSNFTWQNDLIDRPIDVNEVLVDDHYYREHHHVFHFVSFTKVSMDRTRYQFILYFPNQAFQHNIFAS